MPLFNLFPPAVLFGRNGAGLINENDCSGQEIEKRARGAGIRVILPARKDSDAGFGKGIAACLGVALDSRAGKPCMHLSQNFFANWRFRERQQNYFIHRGSGALGAGIKLADRFNLVAKQLDAQRPVGFRRVGVKQAAANGILARHLYDVHGGVADGVQVRPQLLDVNLICFSNRARQAGVMLRVAQAHGSSFHAGNHDLRRSGCDLP
jgi:hypothetical protein